LAFKAAVGCSVTATPDHSPVFVRAGLEALVARECAPLGRVGSHERHACSRFLADACAYCAGAREPRGYTVWIDHLRVSDRRLVAIILYEQILAHPFVIGELACGSMNRRGEMLGLLEYLPQIAAVPQPEVLMFVERRALMGKGLGWIDVHLLASAVASRHTLWTRDKRPTAGARRLGLGA
jgi:predicted nucleic acid-binding protein